MSRLDTVIACPSCPEQVRLAYLDGCRGVRTWGFSHKFGAGKGRQRLALHDLCVVKLGSLVTVTCRVCWQVCVQSRHRQAYEALEAGRFWWRCHIRLLHLFKRFAEGQRYIAHPCGQPPRRVDGSDRKSVQACGGLCRLKLCGVGVINIPERGQVFPCLCCDRLLSGDVPNLYACERGRSVTRKRPCEAAQTTCDLLDCERTHIDWRDVYPDSHVHHRYRVSSTPCCVKRAHLHEILAWLINAPAAAVACCTRIDKV